MTKYQVFRKVESVVQPGGTPAERDITATSFVPVGEFEGNDAKAAVKAAILAMPEKQRAEASTQTFAACASSSWQLLTPTVNVETTVSFA